MLAIDLYYNWWVLKEPFLGIWELFARSFSGDFKSAKWPVRVDRSCSGNAVASAGREPEGNFKFVIVNLKFVVGNKGCLTF